MRSYIQTDKSGEFFNINAYVAYQGFREFGWEIVKFLEVEKIKNLNPEDILVGGIGNVRKRLSMLGFPEFPHLDYPPELNKYLGRKIWATTLQEIFENESSWNVFVKPKETTKKFTGKVFSNYSDFIGIIDRVEPISVWCSEIVEFVTEWRCFIRYGEILDVRYYCGAWDSKIDLEVVRQAIKDFETAPRAYGLDFGIDKTGQMLLVEVNEGHSLGGYGISSTNYAKFLSARWSELTQTKDYLYF